MGQKLVLIPPMAPRVRKAFILRLFLFAMKKMPIKLLCQNQYMRNDYIVYCHTLKKDNRKYIGVTCQKPSLRWANGIGYRQQYHFYNAIKKYGWDAFDHEILFENLTKEKS